MATEIINLATPRSGANAPDPRRVNSNQLDELLTAQGLPPYTEMTRKFNYVSAMNTSALAALVVRPGTTANFTLFNNEPAGGKSYVIDRMFAFNLVSTAAEARSGMWYCVHKPGLVSPTADITARGWGRGSAGSSNSITDTAMTVIDDGWFPAGPFSTVEPTGVLPGAIMEVRFEGRIIVPPLCGFSTQVVSSVVGNTFTTGFAWWEVPSSFLTLEN